MFIFIFLQICIMPSVLRVKNYRNNTVARKLAQAIADHNNGLVERLIRENPQVVNKKIEGQKTPLHVAVQQINLPATHILLNCGANTHATDWKEETPLLFASKEGYADKPRYSASHMAQIYKLLLIYSPPLDIPDMDGVRPLYAALRHRKKKTFLALLNRGANPNFITPTGRTLVTEAKFRRTFLEFLIKLPQVDFNMVDRFGKTFYDY